MKNKCIAAIMEQIENEIKLNEYRVEKYKYRHPFKYKNILIGLNVAKKICKERLHKKSLC